MTEPDMLKRQIAHEPTSLSLNADDADPLGRMLPGLLSGQPDLDGRVQALEAVAEGECAESLLAADQDQQRPLPCGIRTWFLPMAMTVTV